MSYYLQVNISAIAAFYWAVNVLAVQAQQKKSEIDDPTSMDEIIVKAARPGEVRRRRGPDDGLGRKSLDNYASEDVGDALDRLDSIITGEEGEEGAFFSIGGMAPELSQITLNGQILGAEGEQGGFSPGNLPSEMIRSVEVNKNPRAEMEEGASSGRVNVRLRSPLSIGKRLITFNSRLSYSALSGHFNPSLSALWSNIYIPNKLGIMINISYNQRLRRRDSLSNTGWQQINLDFDGDGRNEYTSVWQARNLKFGIQSEDRRRIGANFVLAIKPSEKLEISINGLLSRQDREIDFSSLDIRYNRQREIVGAQVGGGIITQLTTADTNRQNLRLSVNTRQENLRAHNFSTEVTYHTNLWHLSAEGGLSRNENSYDRPSLNVNFTTNSVLGYDIRNGPLPAVEIGADINDSRQFNSSKLSGRLNHTLNDGYYGQFDIAYRRENSVLRTIKFGLKFREKGRSREVFHSSLRLDPAILLVDFERDFPYKNFLPSYEPPHPTDWPLADNNALEQNFIPQNTLLRMDLTQGYDINEQTRAAYFQGGLRGRFGDKIPFRGNVGARLVETWTSTLGARQFGGRVTPVSIQRRYTDILPSANLSLRLKKGVFFRLGAARVMTRPSFSLLSPGFRLNIAQKTGSAGNPDLSPYYVNQFELALDMRFARRSRLSLAFFYKDVDSFFARAQRNELIEGDNFLITKPLNGKNAEIYGFEMTVLQKLSFLPDPLKPLALSIYYVRSTSKTDFRDVETGAILPLPGLARDVVKATASFAKNNFQARLSYSYRSRILRSLSGIGGLAQYAASIGQMSLNLSYKYGKNITLSLSGHNLTDSVRTSYEGDPRRLVSYRPSGRSFSLSMRLKY